MCFRPPEVHNEKKCPKCGVTNPDEATTCSECGAEFEDAGFLSVPPAVPGAPRAPRPAGAAGPVTPPAPRPKKTSSDAAN